MKDWIPFHQHAFLVSSVLCLFLVTVLLIWKVFKKPRNLVVNCWFCNINSTVAAENFNCWDCPHCDQYNGFDKDGNYNKPILAQQYSELNQKIYISKTAADNDKFRNILCEQCNQNQQLKIQQLALFIPDDERTYDFEIEEYADHLNSLYQLCLGCELQAQRKIDDIDDWVHRKLLGKRLLQFRNFTSKKSVPPLLPAILRWFILLCLVLVLALDIYTLLVTPDSSNSIVGQLTFLVSIVILTLGILYIKSDKRQRLCGLVSTLCSIVLSASRLDNFLDKCLLVFPWRLKMHMVSKGVKIKIAEQRVIVRIMVDAMCCIVAIVIMMRSVLHKEINIHRKNINKPVSTDLPRQSRFSSQARNKVDCSTLQNSQTMKLQCKVGGVETDQHPLNTSLESLSIVDEEHTKKGPEPFTQGKERRPLISPAKFTVSDSVRQRKYLVKDIDTPISVSLASSRASSVHDGVDSTVADGDYKLQKGSVKDKQEMKCSAVMYILFGVSLGINVTIIIGFLFWNVLHNTA